MHETLSSNQICHSWEQLQTFGKPKLFSNSVSGCTDYFAEDEQEAFQMGRDIAETLPFHASCTYESDPPLYDADDIPGLITAENKIDIYQVKRYC